MSAVVTFILGLYLAVVSLVLMGAGICSLIGFLGLTSLGRFFDEFSRRKLTIDDEVAKTSKRFKESEKSIREIIENNQEIQKSFSGIKERNARIERLTIGVREWLRKDL